MQNAIFMKKYQIRENGRVVKIDLSRTSTSKGLVGIIKSNPKISSRKAPGSKAYSLCEFYELTEDCINRPDLCRVAGLYLVASSDLLKKLDKRLARLNSP